jgi:hypothetical protein
MLEEWNDGRLGKWNIDLPGFRGLCMEKPVRSDDTKYEILAVHGRSLKG